PYTIGGYLAGQKPNAATADRPEFQKAIDEVHAGTKKLLSIQGKRTVDDFHRALGTIMWSKCGMARNEQGLQQGIAEIQALRAEFWTNVKVLGSDATMNQSLEKAGRVADFLEFGELMCRDALERRESCGGHFREEWQDDGEAKRDDENFRHAAVWEYAGRDRAPVRHQESLEFENVHLAVRSYK
ncbi:MAG: fumarate reductase/succinate dehydrogenase flavoprotein subunit, partial [Planctomycetota bacterium]